MKRRKIIGNARNRTLSKYAKLSMTAYKSKFQKFKFDKDPLQRRIYFLTFNQSLQIHFS